MQSIRKNQMAQNNSKMINPVDGTTIEENEHLGQDQIHVDTCIF